MNEIKEKSSELHMQFEHLDTTIYAIIRTCSSESNLNHLLETLIILSISWFSHIFVEACSGWLDVHTYKRRFHYIQTYLYHLAKVCVACIKRTHQVALENESRLRRNPSVYTSIAYISLSRGGETREALISVRVSLSLKIQRKYILAHVYMYTRMDTSCTDGFSRSKKYHC